AGVRRNRASQPSCPVQGKTEEALIRHPEDFVESTADIVCALGSGGRMVVLSAYVGQRGERPMRRVRVPLYFDEGHRRCDSEMILGAVFPSLVEQSVRILSLICDESVWVLVAVDPYPAIRGSDRRPEIRQRAKVPGSLDVLPGDNQKEKGRVNAPVIRELPVRKLGLGGRVEPVFMQDLAWLLLRFRIDT